MPVDSCCGQLQTVNGEHHPALSMHSLQNYPKRCTPAATTCEEEGHLCMPTQGLFASLSQSFQRIISKISYSCIC